MASPNSTSELEEHGDKFQYELQWCIKKLEIGLQRQATDHKQAAETVRILKILKSKKAPVVKKRQVMRCALGDYRKMMKEEEKKSLLSVRHSRFVPGDLGKQKGRSRFLRHSTKHQAGDTTHSIGEDDGTTHFNTASTSQISNTVHSKCSSASAPCDSVMVPGSSSQADLTTTIDELQISEKTQNHQEISAQSSISGEASTSYSTSTIVNGNDRNHLLSNQNGSPTSETTSAKSIGKSFHFEPSDNSFCFMFDTRAPEESCVGPRSVSSHGEQSCAALEDDKSMSVATSKNTFTLERSNNDFTFNFAPGD